MFNDGGNGNNHVPVEKKSFRIKQDDKFFSRLMSKETSMANTSSRVFYYGETSVAVPFVWEAQPGTPKHPLSETSLLPPLTPPPSYHTNSKSNHKRRSSKGNGSNIFSCILPRFAGSSRKNTEMSPSSSWSSSSLSSTSSSSSSWSLVYPSSSTCSIIRDKDHHHHQRSLSFSKQHKASSSIGFIRGCYPFGSMKKNNAILNHEASNDDDIHQGKLSY